MTLSSSSADLDLPPLQDFALKQEEAREEKNRITMSFRSTSSHIRRRRFVTHDRDGSSSSRRLSCNPDVLHDVHFHVTDQFARRKPARRHSIASLGGVPPIPPPQLRTRATSEKISKSDEASLLWEEDRGDSDWITPQSRKVLDDLLEEDLLEESPLVESKGPSPASTTWMLVLGLSAGYLLSSIGLQKLNDLRPGCGQLVTLLQYLATIAEKAPHARSYFYSPVIPMHWHWTFVFLMFLSIKMGNASLGVGLPFGLFLVIKNTNLAWSLLLGLSTGRSFTAAQILSIGIVSAGISICVFAQNQGEETSSKDVVEDESNGFWLGAVLCAASTFCMAALGSLQEVIFAFYRDSGHQEASESLFFTHLLGLPLFALGGGMDKMRDDVFHLLKTPGTTISMLTLNILSTLVVKQCFVQLLEEGESVTATLTLTVARMTGVILSQMLESSSSLSFWLGALLVATGSISYATGGRLLCRAEQRQ